MRFYRLTPIIVITPINALTASFETTVESVFSNMRTGDIWYIVIDKGSEEINKTVKRCLLTAKRTFHKKEIECVLVNSGNNKGAGNARNYGLKLILESQITLPFILTFLDSDDFYKHNYFDILRNYFLTNKGIVTYSYEITKKSKVTQKIHENVTINYENFLKYYCSSCLSTALLITNYSDLKLFKFGNRKRANDQLFFLSAVKKFGQIKLNSEIVATYNISKTPTLSNRKYKMPLYKFLALRDHGLTIYQTVFYLFFYVKNSILSQINSNKN